MGVWGWDETGKATGFTGSCALCHHLAQPQCSAWQVISFSNIRKPRQQNSWGFTKDSRLCCVAGMAGPSGCLPPLSPRREGTPELPAPLVTHTPDKPTKSLPPTTAPLSHARAPSRTHLPSPPPELSPPPQPVALLPQAGLPSACSRPRPISL